MRQAAATRSSLVASLLLLLLAWPAPAAAAPECDLGVGRRCRCDGWVGPAGCERRHRARACHREARHVCRFVARGQSWALLSRHLAHLRIEPTHRHPRSFFLRRWPCGEHGRPTRWGGRTCIGHDFPSTECPLVLAALRRSGDGEAPAAADLSRDDRLMRAMERFYRSAWDLAAEDFEIAAALDEQDARPRWGLALCDVMRRRWTDATRHLGRLAELGALGREDRLDLEGSFEDPARFTRLRLGLVDWVRWSFHEVDGQIVTAWTYALTGEMDAARRHVRAALRFAPENAVARYLRAVVGENAATTPHPREAAPQRELSESGNVARTGGERPSPVSD